jgi:outer membrane protein, heavy metal efflux system
MTLVITVPSRCCRGSIECNWSVGASIELIRRVVFPGIVFAFLLASDTNPVAAQSQQPAAVTVNQAVHEAIEKNLSLLAERYNLPIADARVVTARLRPNPVLSIGGDHLDLLGTGYNHINNAGPQEYSIRTDFLLERGGKRQYRIEVSEKARDVARLQLLNSTRGLVLDVQNASVDVLLAKESLELARENLESFQKIIEINQVKVRAGDIARVELVRTQLAALQFNNAVVQARSRLRIARQRLQLLMGRNAISESFDIVGELRREPLLFSLAELQQQALNKRPDYLALQRDQARSIAEVRSQIAQGKVDYTIGTEYRRQDGSAGRGNSLGFFVSVPLPVFNRNQGEIERARQEQRQIEGRILALEAEIGNEVGAAWQQYDTARTLLTQIEADMLKQSQQVLHAMEFSYRAGQASFVEFLDARRAYNDTMQTYNEARAEYARSLFLIDSITGKGIPQ